MSILTKILGDANARELKRLAPLVEEINSFEQATKALSDEGIREKSEELKKRAQDDEALDDLLPEAFALVRETARRALGERHYDVQLLGAIVLHQGKIVEMRTGEGKTLAATAPVYLNALSGEGVHVVTVNDYLAKRDTGWMGEIYHALGLTTGCVTQGGAFRYREITEAMREEADEERDMKGSFQVFEEFLEEVTKHEAYACDVTYGTNNEFGFDYLRDSMVLSRDQLAQRRHAFAIVDEVDSILIDEARTPLIISAPDIDAPRHYETFARLAPRLKEEEDYELDEKRRAALITEAGVKKVEGWLGMGNLYEEGLRLVHYLEQALRAHVLYQRDRDYVVKDGEVIIVDEFTGRLMPGRRWSEGLHQAVEAKEGVKLQAESRTLATITFQNYFRMYEKLSGMTGTAVTSAEEFHKVYELEVVVIPTAKPMVRDDKADLVFRNEAGKWKALVAAVREKYEKGQPVLIGTTSIAKNETVSALLEREGIKHEVLNAKQHEREGSIIAQAGRKGAVTVATNMAGRGVDVILGGNPYDAEEAQTVCGLGGLAVFGTERHEARRIDNQLRGRSGRQGDPGDSQFFLSLEDDLLRIFAGDRIKGLMSRLNLPEDQPIESGIVSKSIESAQGRIEGQNFDIRKHLLDYDDVTNKHREAIYRRRKALLEGEDIHEEIERFFSEEIESILLVHLSGDIPEDWNIEEFTENFQALMPLPEDAHAVLLGIAGEAGEVDVRREGIREWVQKAWDGAVKARREELGEENFRLVEQQVLLRSIDALWVEHLEHMEALRDAVSLRAYGQRDPLAEYKVEGRRAFRQLEASIRSRAIQMFFRVQMRGEQRQGQPQNIRLHRGEGAKPEQSGETPAKGKKSEKVGRNDPCPCGATNPATGEVYKYKKCGLINAPHHRKG